MFRGCWVGLGVGEEVGQRVTEKLPLTPRGNSESRTMRKIGPVLGSPGPESSPGLGPLDWKLVPLFSRTLPCFLPVKNGRKEEGQGKEWGKACSVSWRKRNRDCALEPLGRPDRSCPAQAAPFHHPLPLFLLLFLPLLGICFAGRARVNALARHCLHLVAEPKV